MSLKPAVSVYDIQQEIKYISSITQYSQLSVYYKNETVNISLTHPELLGTTYGFQSGG